MTTRNGISTFASVPQLTHRPLTENAWRATEHSIKGVFAAFVAHGNVHGATLEQLSAVEAKLVNRLNGFYTTEYDICNVAVKLLDETR